ncbi:DmsC/YnfH family molybdoenzyme membrane anchor subunit [Adlercreutzia sp. ZJ242]|uniref:DmsC/YnfH family molybdoenzyme membrane anchor subunit n=1 Tax=Adlercreutzia sp. ZJ242 TaxID=2709409 RepID=UPI0013EBC22A|nr:DmsC/YnfH family molybdoenzyme membrane anchor subunit [Adlercreutzia sp. ZJ242]
MSVVLREERRSELPLIAFTTLVSAAEGVCLCALAGMGVSALVGGGAFDLAGLGALAALAWVLTSIGMAASVAHLAKPLRAPRSLANLRSSWLSREIAAVSAFWALLFAWLAACALGRTLLAVAANLLAVAAGAALLVVVALAYRVSPRPAWCGPEGLAELWACALGAGPAASFALAGGGAMPLAASCAFVAVSLGGLAVDVWSHRARRGRLQAIAPRSDERVSLTLARYAQLWPCVWRLWAAEGVCCVVFAAAVVLAGVGVHGVVVAALAAAAAVGQLCVHAQHRNLFYELPVQVRWAARLRK